jgi:hypothetical protein
MCLNQRVAVLKHADGIHMLAVRNPRGEIRICLRFAPRHAFWILLLKAGHALIRGFGGVVRFVRVDSFSSMPDLFGSVALRYKVVKRKMMHLCDSREVTCFTSKQVVWISFASGSGFPESSSTKAYSK